MLLALAGKTVPRDPYRKRPFVYLAYLTAGLLWLAFHNRGVYSNNCSGQADS